MEVNYDDYESYLLHYGTPRHSGRYPWGSGDNPYQRSASFRKYVLDLRKQGMSNAEIARGMGMTRKALEAKLAAAKTEVDAHDAALCRKLKDKGWSNVAIGKRLGRNESSVRGLLKQSEDFRQNASLNTADALARSLEEKGGYLDVGLGVEGYLGVSKYALANAVEILRERGYPVHRIKILQLGTGNKTTMNVLAPPGTEWAEVMKNKGDIRLPTDQHSYDGGRSVLGLEKPVAIDPKRIHIRYADEKGADGATGLQKDGVIELRRGVDDISLGAANYAQVRINVGDSHYLKGMAIYSDDMPKGIDIIFNTSKHSDTPMMGAKDNSVLKPMKVDKQTGEIDWDNPFGATIKGENALVMAQRRYKDKNGKEQLSAINIVKEEGDWDKWANTLSSQFLSKQTESMAKKQLGIDLDSRKAMLSEIQSLTNPTVQKKLLSEFADECDSASVNLKAAALPRQSNFVILPVNSLKDNEVYAPTFREGEQVALVRHPHAGRFEIPVLKVNNRNKDAAKVVGNKSPDAIAINAKVAAQLSGADFDGDSVLAIPIKGTGLKAKARIESLVNFEPKEAYRAYPGMPETGPKNGFDKQNQMGQISNLITDMTIKGASEEKIIRAVRHSMVVIDAEKHNLDWRRSAADNDIASLKAEYQGRPNGGASTLISKASSDYRVDERKEISPDKRTGERRYVLTGRTYEKDGKVVKSQIVSTKMAETKDARELSSGTMMEEIYADYANELKRMANNARKEAMSKGSIPYSSSARKAYAKEVAELNAGLERVKKNKPLERQAQIMANVVVDAKKASNPDLRLKENKDDLKKVQQQALREARARTGAKSNDIDITDRQWEAIQSGAIHKTKLEEILANSDPNRVRELALPKTKISIPPSTVSRIKNMSSNGSTLAEIADAIGISTSTVSQVIQNN